MKTRIKPGLLLFLAFLFFKLHTLYAQKEDIAKVQSLFYKELRKSGVQTSEGLLELSINGSVLKGTETQTSIPADAFHINVLENVIQITSISVDGLRNGVFWYLEQLGFRYYMPGELWEYIPKLNTAFKTMNRTVTPSFTHRRIWYAYGTDSKRADADYKKWSQANLLGGEEVNSGHSYDAIVQRNKAVFAQHPEYFAQKVVLGKIPANPKFDVTNKALVELVIRDAFSQVEKRLKETGELPGMISMDPSDGGGFSMSEASLKIGGASEQTFFLANIVAKRIREKYSTIKVGVYAYNQHAAPPRFDLEPNIVVLVATAMNQSAYRTDELIDLWKKKGVQVGIRDYYGVMAWDWDMPGQPKGSKINSIMQLKDYHKKGVRFFSAETNIGWISRGLGHYVATRLLWNVNADTEKIQEEFFENLFGEAAAEMEELFKKWQKYNQPIPQDGDIHAWSRLLEQASKKNVGVEQQKRIDQVKQYLHYVVLFKNWKANGNDENLAALLNYAYRVKDDGIVASYPLFRRIANASVISNTNMRFKDPKAKWKLNNAPVESAEIQQDFLSDMTAASGGTRIALIRFPVAENFKGRESRLASRGTSPPAPASSTALRLRGGHKIIFRVQEAQNFLNISSGLIKAREHKSLRLSIFPYQEDLETEGATALLTETIQAGQPLKSVALSQLQPGIYIAVVDDAKAGFTFSVTGDITYGILSGNPGRIWTFGRNNLVFAVNNVKEFQVRNEGAITLVSPTGRKIDLQKQKGLITIKILEGEYGIWKAQRQSGVFYLQGILPLVSATDHLLLKTKN